MRAVIVAGGQGKRIFPFDENMQKCFLPVGNVPNAVRLVRALKGAGIAEITAVAEHESEWAQHFLRTADVKIVKSADTASAVYDACKGDDALIVYGDIYVSPSDIKRVAEYSGECAFAALVAECAADTDKGRYICADVQNGEIKSFYGHPRRSYGNSISAGVFLLKSQQLGCLKSACPVFQKTPVGGMPPKGFWVENCLSTAVADGAKTAAVFAAEPLADIDLPFDLLRANMLCARRENAMFEHSEVDPTAQVHPCASYGKIKLGRNCVIGEGVIIRGSCIVGDNTVIRNCVVIEDGCIIGSDCLIENYCRLHAYTVIGNGCKIGFSAEINGVLMDGVSAVHGCELNGVFGKNTDIGAGTRSADLRFDDKPASVTINGRSYTDPLANAGFVGSYCRTGVNCTLLPGALVGAYSCIGPGVVLGGTVGPRKLVLQKKETVVMDWGPEKYGW